MHRHLNLQPIERPNQDSEIVCIKKMLCAVIDRAVEDSKGATADRIVQWHHVESAKRFFSAPGKLEEFIDNCSLNINPAYYRRKMKERLAK